MKNETRNEGWYGRFLHWAGGEEPDGPEGPEDPERQEFLEYLEYIEAHGDMEFGAYRLMRYRSAGRREWRARSPQRTGLRSGGRSGGPPEDGGPGRCGGSCASTGD